MQEYPECSFWVSFFRHINKSDFLTGRKESQNGKAISWRPDFDWVINPDNMTKIIEGKCDNDVADFSDDEAKKVIQKRDEALRKQKPMLDTALTKESKI